MPVDAFISYSHADEKALERLHKHLAMLRREGELTAWSDHKILPGAKLASEILAALEKSGLFLALVSADYIASNYCYETEFKHALRLAEGGRMRIVPIILEPCDWLASPLREFLALPKDGKPVSEWTNQNNAFLDIVTGIRRLLQAAPAITPVAETSQHVPRRRPRIKRGFDAIQKSEFVDDAFARIRGYFETSCAELNSIGDGNIKAKFENMDANAFTCTVVNRALLSNGESHITIRNTKQARHGGDIVYVYQRHAQDNVSNGWINVGEDEYNLFLTVSNLSHTGRGAESKLGADQVANILWLDFVERAGIEYE